MNLRTPRERCHNDSQFRMLVDMMVAHIMQCQYTPSEMREAAVLASIICENQRIRPMQIPIPENVEGALAAIHDWTTTGPKREVRDNP